MYTVGTSLILLLTYHGRLQYVYLIGEGKWGV